MLIKTKDSLFPRLQMLIKEHHPYTTPEIIYFRIDGVNQEYLSWLNKRNRSVTDLLVNLEKLFNTSPALGLAASFLAHRPPVVALHLPVDPVTLSIIGAKALTSPQPGILAKPGVCLRHRLHLYRLRRHRFFAGGSCWLNFLFNPLVYALLAVAFLFLGLSLFDVVKFNIFSLSYEYQSRPEHDLAVYFRDVVKRTRP